MFCQLAHPLEFRNQTYLEKPYCKRDAGIEAGTLLQGRISFVWIRRIRAGYPHSAMREALIWMISGQRLC